MYKVYIPIYVSSLIIYIVFYNLINASFFKSNFGCLMNDIIFYTNLIFYFLIVSELFNNKQIFLVIGALFILLRYILIEYFSNYFSNYFGYNSIEYKCDRLFYNLLSNNDNYLSKIYSKFGPIINNIEFYSRGTNKENGKSNFLLKFLFDFIHIDKTEKVISYFKNVLKKDIQEYKNEIDKVIELLDKKYLISKIIWNIILITILFCLSLKYI